METSSQIDKNTLLNEIVSYTKERVETYISNYSKYKEDYENLKTEIMNLSVFKELLHEHDTLKSKQDKYKDSEEVVNTISNLNAFSKIITENAKLKEEITNHMKFEKIKLSNEDLEKWINSFVNNVMLVYYGFYKWDKLRGDFYKVIDLENLKFGEKIPDQFEKNNEEFSKFINFS